MTDSSASPADGPGYAADTGYAAGAGYNPDAGYAADAEYASAADTSTDPSADDAAGGTDDPGPADDPGTAGDPGPADDPANAVPTERDLLESFLDHQRAVTVRKVSGLSERDARRRIVPSMTTLAGIIKHLTGVERGWFQYRLGQFPLEELGPNVGGGQDSWELGPDDTVESLSTAYEVACAQSRAIATQFDLDQAVPHPRLGQISLRWIYLHMIEETARHAGHADILRELIDGSTGDAG